ncbi:MAG: isochorismate synthase [Cyclobacteriaceae bacterium]
MLKEVNSSVFTLTDLRIDQSLKAIFKTAIELNFPVALWRLPLTDEINLIVDLSGKSKEVKPELEALPNGFIAHPFNSEGSTPARFISADLIYSSQGQSLKVNPVFKDTHTTELFFQALQLNQKTSTCSSLFHQPNTGQPHLTSKDEFVSNVKSGIEQIRDGVFKKVVLSRTKPLELSASFDLIEKFNALCDAYPGAFVNLVSLPTIGTWLGATPELLVSQNKQGIFKTVSLAGTQKAEANTVPLEIGWTQKEIEEQAYVGRYIIDCFKKIRLREFDEEGPKTTKAANLYHLKSEYRVDTKAVNFPQLASVMLELLHPTSAVCGMPKTPALEFILDIERHDRSFYAGFLGPVNVNQESHIYVNLRCMQLFKSMAVLYAGAGITEHSKPEKEWLETDMKCNTLLDVFDCNN